MRIEAALETAEELIESGDFDPEDKARIGDDILKAASLTYGKEDGFSLAYELKRSCHWEIEDDTIETLAGYWGTLRGKLRLAEEQWAVENPMKPPFPIGTLVRTSSGVFPIVSVSDYVPHTYYVQQSSHRMILVRFEDAVSAE
jgi:hypothetical protein